MQYEGSGLAKLKTLSTFLICITKTCFMIGYKATLSKLNYTVQEEQHTAHIY